MEAHCHAMTSTTSRLLRSSTRNVLHRLQWCRVSAQLFSPGHMTSKQLLAYWIHVLHNDAAILAAAVLTATDIFIARQYYGRAPLGYIPPWLILWCPPKVTSVPCDRSHLVRNSELPVIRECAIHHHIYSVSRLTFPRGTPCMRPRRRTRSLHMDHIRLSSRRHPGSRGQLQ